MTLLHYLLEWSYFVYLLHLIHDRSANMVCRQRSLEAKMISLRAMAATISCLLVGVGTQFLIPEIIVNHQGFLTIVVIRNLHSG
jgi:hypothetical protein